MSFLTIGTRHLIIWGDRGWSVDIGSDFPSKSSSAKDSSPCTIQRREHELCFTLEYIQHIVIVSLLDRVHDKVTRFSEPSEENKRLWRRESGKVCTSPTKHVTCKLEYLKCNRVTMFGSLEDIVALNLLRVNIP